MLGSGSGSQQGQEDQAGAQGQEGGVGWGIRGV